MKNSQNMRLELTCRFLFKNSFIKFAKFEIRCKEYERARGIFKFALEKLPKEETDDL